MKWLGKHKVFQDLMIGGVLLTPPDPTYEYELTLPNDDGSSGQVLQTDGSGVLSWVANGVAVPNALTVGDGLQLNSGTTFDGSAARTISTDIKANSGIVIDSTELSMDLGASSITGVLANSDVAEDLTITAGTIENTPIGASTANTIKGTTIDATTDFTIGTTVITDDSIVMTPSTSDTVTIAAATNGALNITTVDDNAHAADITITADGDAEIAADVITLDSAANIELEVGATTNYVQTTGIFRGGNVGPISDTFIPIMPSEFMMSDSYRYPGQMLQLSLGKEMSPAHVGVYYVVQKMIPNGYTASSVTMYGTDGGGTAAAFICYENRINGATPAAVSVSFAFGTQAFIGGREIVGDGLKFCTIVFDPGHLDNRIYGGSITIAKT